MIPTNHEWQTYRNLVGGQWTNASSGELLEIKNPATGETVGFSQKSTVVDVEQAIDSAHRTFHSSQWGFNPKQRYEALLGLAKKMEERQEQIARVLTLENGKPIREARFEVASSIDTLKYYAGMARNVFGRSMTLEPNNFGIIAKEPIGVVGIISPWNWPVLLMIRELAPALAAGCAVIVKPASLTPLSSVEIFKCIAQVPEFEPGIVSIVTGPGAQIGSALAGSDKIDMISFTGDTSTGRTIMQLAASNIKKLALELGGKSPNIVFSDANLEKAIPFIGRSIFISAGQICMAGSRVLVEESIKEEVVGRLKEYAEKLVVGNGIREETDMGPVISGSQLSIVQEYSNLAKEQGEIITGGYRLIGGEYEKGYYFAPTIVEGLSQDCRVVQEEIFGPILTVQSFRDEEEAIALANGTKFGLTAGIWTNQVQRVQRFMRSIKAGTIWVNTYNRNFPEAEFGGFKQSGLGRTRGIEGLLEYTETKHIHFESE